MKTSVSDEGSKSGSLNIILIGGALALLIGVFILGQSSRSITLNRSAAGFDGLALWLNKNEVQAQTFYGRAALDSEAVSLRILPLFDVDLTQGKSLSLIHI